MILVESVSADQQMRPKTDSERQTERVQIVASPSWIAAVDEWRGTQRPIPSLSAAIRLLVESALEDAGRETTKIAKNSRS